MPYTDFDVPTVETRFGVQILPGDVFPELTPTPVPTWLTEMLARGTQLRVESEKARNEFIIAPILLAVRELSNNAVSIFSGERFDVDTSDGLAGECDFLLALSPTVPIIRAPVMFVVEAKKQDIAGGIGQCAAQMIAARRFNVRNARPLARVYGCVTTGEVWQFLRLDERVVSYHTNRLFLDDVGLILSAFLHTVTENIALAATSAA
jgi:hypothetical protein